MVQLARGEQTLSQFFCVPHDNIARWMFHVKHLYRNN